MCAVLFDGPDGGQALPEAGSLMALGVEEIHLLEKVHQIIRASPGKAAGLFEKFRQILREEKKEELICNQCPGFNHRDDLDTTQMRSSLLPPPSHDTASVRRLQKEKKKNMKSKEASQKKKRKKNKKIKKIAKMKKIKQRRKVQQGNRRTKNLEKLEELKCVDMWAELTNVGLGVATTLMKQVETLIWS